MFTLRSMPRRSAIWVSSSISASRAASTSSAQRGRRSNSQATMAPEITSRRSVSGSSSAPRRLYWPVIRATMPSSWSLQAMKANRMVAAVSRPSPESSARTRNTGIKPSRTNPMAFGIVQGWSAWPRSVSGGGAPGRAGPLRRRPRGSGKTRPKLRGRRGGALEGQRALLLGAPDLHVHLAGLEASLADRQAQRAAEQLRVGELLPRAAVAVVVEHVEALVAEVVVKPVRHLAGLLPLLTERHELDVERGHRAGPRDSLLVGVLLDRGRHYARGPDAVRAHPDQLLLALLVEVAGAERLGVAGAELEDVAHLDRRLDLDRRAVRAGVPLLHAPHVAPARLEVAARLHAAQVHVVLIAAGDEPVKAAQRLVGEHLDGRAERPDEAGLGLEDRPHLLGLGRPRGRAEGVLQLDLVEAVVAPHQHQDGAAPVRDHGDRLDHRPGGDAEQAGPRLPRGGAP